MQKYIYFSILQNKSSFIFRKGMRVEFFLYLLLKKKSIGMLSSMTWWWQALRWSWLIVATRLSLGISLSTDLKEYCRRGYSEKSFNTSDLVWNASLARSFCKGKLMQKAEKWNNTLPSYAMLHLMYSARRRRVKYTFKDDFLWFLTLLRTTFCILWNKKCIFVFKSVK